MKMTLIAFGFLPFAVGGIINWIMMTYSNSVPPLFLIGLVFLLLWGVIAFFARSYIKSSKKVVIMLNLVASVVLVLLGIQELVLGTYWFNFVGVWSQFFYLPLINIGFTLTSWSTSVFPAYCVSFVLMVAASILGCNLRKK